VVEHLKAKGMVQKKAVETLGISGRQVKSLWKNYQEKCTAGLVSQRRGKLFIKFRPITLFAFYAKRK